MEKIFDVMGCEDAFKTRLAVYKFEGNALACWKSYKQAKGGDAWLITVTWAKFKKLFFLQFFPRAEQERLKREYHSIRQTNTETSTEFMQRFLRLTGFLGAAVGTEEEQAKNFQWGLRRSTLNHLMCMPFTDVAQVANAARNYEILHERDDDDTERPDKRQKSGDRHQPTTQQSSHRNYGHNNDRHGSDKRGGGDNHRSRNNNYSGNNIRLNFKSIRSSSTRKHDPNITNTTASTSGQADKKPGASGRVFAITECHATKTSEIVALKAEMEKINKNLMKVLQINQKVKKVTHSCETCGGPHSYNDCLATVGQTQNGNNQGRNQFFQRASHGQNPPPAYQALTYQAPSYQAPIHQASIPQPQVVTTTEFTNYMKANDAILKNMQTNMTSLTNSNLEPKNMFGQFMKMNIDLSSGSETLPSNTITNPKEDLNGITTRSGNEYKGPTIPTTSSTPKVVKRKTELTKDTVPPTNNGSTKDVQPLSLLTNKDKLFELARTPLNEHCSAILLKKLPEKLGDPGKILIPCDFLRMDECLALADIGTSINLMPLSMWIKLSFLELSPTCMTLELTDRSISRLVRVAEDVFVKVGTFHFPTDFVVVDFDADPRVSLILGRSFLKFGHAFIDVYAGELTLPCKEYSQEVLEFSVSGNLTPSTKPIVSISSATLTPFGDSDFLLEETDAFLAIDDEPILSEIDDSYYDSEGDILLLEEFLNDDPSPWVSPVHCVPKKGGFTVVENEENELIPTRLVTGWREKIHFMVKEGIVLGHKISKNGIEVILLQEFDIIIRDKKGAENLAADHLSRLENPHQSVLDKKEINEMFPLETLSVVSFRGLFPSSRGNKYILVAVDYLSKRVEAKALPTNDARVVCKILKSLFDWFGAPRAIISDRGTYFCNDQFTKVMLKYGVTNRLAIAYHPQTNGQVEVSNRGLKRILDRTVTDIKEKDKIKAKTRQNQARNGKRGKVNQVKAKVKVKPVKTGHGFGKSAKNQSQRRKYLIGPTPNAITLDLPTVEPEDSLRIGDKHLVTIPETESNKFIKSSVENLVPIPNDSKDLSDNECVVPACDDFTTFSNLLFDADDDFSSSDDKSFFYENIPKEIYSNPLFDEEIISMKIDPHHFNAESDLIESLLNQDSSIISSSLKIDSLLDDDSFMEEIDLTLTPDDSMPLGIDDYDYESERDILILEELPSNDSLSLSENESLHFDIPSSPRPPAKPPDNDEIEPNSGILTVKVVGDVFEQYVPMPIPMP
uniref:Zinc finger, CCHC-type, retrotransposon Gag domain protein n=1 Tax=Tanacetum cinerariifolium TaxID=118510 RepID=A0A6L2JT51_TANCI|nr:zinc finger, CCHC-type, retrotransposon Gag domain protein [Tanacetum cinerariifolium]